VYTNIHWIEGGGGKGAKSNNKVQAHLLNYLNYLSYRKRRDGDRNSLESSVEKNFHHIPEATSLDQDDAVFAICSGTCFARHYVFLFLV
jgi:hypothetical protein